MRGKMELVNSSEKTAENVEPSSSQHVGRKRMAFRWVDSQARMAEQEDTDAMK